MLFLVLCVPLVFTPPQLDSIASPSSQVVVDLASVDVLLELEPGPPPPSCSCGDCPPPGWNGCFVWICPEQVQALNVIFVDDPSVLVAPSEVALEAPALLGEPSLPALRRTPSDPTPQPGLCVVLPLGIPEEEARATIRVGDPEARPRRGEQARCPLCHSDQDVRAEPAFSCTCCGVTYHQACAEELGGCATLGCERQGLGPEQTPQRPPGWTERLLAWLGRDG